MRCDAHSRGNMPLPRVADLQSSDWWERRLIAFLEAPFYFVLPAMLSLIFALIYAAADRHSDGARMLAALAGKSS